MQQIIALLESAMMMTYHLKSALMKVMTLQSDDDGNQAAVKPSKKDKKAAKAISKDEPTATRDSGG